MGKKNITVIADQSFDKISMSENPDLIISAKARSRDGAVSPGETEGNKKRKGEAKSKTIRLLQPYRTNHIAIWL